MKRYNSPFINNKSLIVKSGYNGYSTFNFKYFDGLVRDTLGCTWQRADDRVNYNPKNAQTRYYFESLITNALQLRTAIVNICDELGITPDFDNVALFSPEPEVTIDDYYALTTKQEFSTLMNLNLYAKLSQNFTVFNRLVQSLPDHPDIAGKYNDLFQRIFATIDSVCHAIKKAFYCDN